MEHLFNQFCDYIIGQLNNSEHLIISFGGEASQFIRLNDAKVRQTGIINDASLSLNLIHNNRSCRGSFTFQKSFSENCIVGKEELSRLREEISQLPEDPFIVLPENKGSSREINESNPLPFEEAVDALIPPIQDVDLVGIWATGKIYRGNANSVGQKHWFETETYSLDYSLVTPDHKMVKGNFAGTDWDQNAYEKNILDSIHKLEIMNRPSVKIKRGDYRTWFTPAAVSEFTGMFSWNGISESCIHQGSSSLCKMRNDELKLSPLFNLSEDFRSGIVPKFNEKGEISSDFLPLIEKGELKNTLVNSRSAKEYNKESNFANDEEYLRSPVVREGDLDESSVLKQLDKGLYLSNLHYLNWSDNIGGRVTGLTRYACFWVENGEIQAPIETMRFDDTIYRFFGSELEAVGKNKDYLPNILTYEGRELGGFNCPGMLVKSFSLTL